MTRMVATVADTVLGYGSSQVLSITTGIADHIGGSHRIFQPFVPHRKYLDISKNGYNVETITAIEHPWCWIGRMQYLKRVAKSIDKIRPDVLILPNYNMIPIIDFLDHRPKKIIHLALEDMDQFGNSYRALHIIRKIKQHVKNIDIWIFPEQNRAIHDCNLLNIPFNRICLFYNVADDVPTSYGLNKRNGRIIYGGSVDFSRTAAHYFADPAVAAQAIDVFGGLNGSDQQKQEFLTATQSPVNKIRYFGEVSAEDLANQLPAYAYSLVYWLPVNWALRNAAPNKLFQAIAAGVPVITAPHPQCVSLIKRYGCGIALKDWEYSTFVSGLKMAIRKIDTTAYQDMIAGCKDACHKELNWDIQFEKIIKHLE